jgi:hypothetical protein
LPQPWHKQRLTVKLKQLDWFKKAIAITIRVSIKSRWKNINKLWQSISRLQIVNKKE